MGNIHSPQNTCAIKTPFLRMSQLHRLRLNLSRCKGHVGRVGKEAQGTNGIHRGDTRDGHTQERQYAHDHRALRLHRPQEPIQGEYQKDNDDLANQVAHNADPE
jgi:hypothetical protein